MKNSDICKSVKPPNDSLQTPMGKYRDPQAPFRMLCLDYMGPFPLSKKGNRQLLVVIDNFSKFVWLQPMRKACAEATTKFLNDKIFRVFGVPEIIISDNGPQLKSKTFQEFLEKYRVTHWATANYHPQANATEAANKTVLNAIRCYIKGETGHREWDENLSEIACAVNSSAHTATKHSPYTILFGMNMPMDGDEHYANVDEEKISDRLKIIRSKVQMHLKSAYENNKQRYDLRSKQREENEFNLSENLAAAYCRMRTGFCVPANASRTNVE